MISNRDVVRLVGIFNTEKVPGHVFSKGLDLIVFTTVAGQVILG